MARVARRDGGQKVGIIVPDPGSVVSRVVIAVVIAVIGVVIRAVRCPSGSWWREGRGERYGW